MKSPTFTPKQQEVLNLMRQTGEPLIKTRYRTRETGDYEGYAVGAVMVNKRTAQALIRHLDGGAKEVSVDGHVVERTYTLPEALKVVA